MGVGRAATDDVPDWTASYITGACRPTMDSVFGNAARRSIRCDSESVRNRATAQRLNSWNDRPAFRLYIHIMVYYCNKNIDSTSKHLRMLLITDTGSRRCRTAVGARKDSGGRWGKRSPRTTVPWNRASTRTVVATPEGPLMGQGPLLQY